MQKRFARRVMALVSTVTGFILSPIFKSALSPLRHYRTATIRLYPSRIILCHLDIADRMVHQNKEKVSKFRKLHFPISPL